MVSEIQKSLRFRAEFEAAMSHPEKMPTSTSNLGHQQSIQTFCSAPMLSSGSLPIESIPNSFPISDTCDVSLFATQKKSCQDTAFIPSCSSKRELNRIEVTGGGLPLESGFGAEVNSLSSFDLEYALLEQALRKDGGSTIRSDQNNAQDCVDKRSGSGLLEPEFLFPDILGEHDVDAEAFSTKSRSDDSLHCSTKFCALNEDTIRRGKHENSHVAPGGVGSTTTDPDLSSALASFVGSDMSADFLGTESSKNCGKEQILTYIDNYSSNGKPPAPRNFQLTELNIGKQSLRLGTIFVAQSQNQVDSSRKSWYEGRKSPPSEKRKDSRTNLHSTQITKEFEAQKTTLVHSPGSDSSMTALEIGSHPDLYANLSEDVREKVDQLQDKIAAMPRRKLRESLAKGVTIEDVEPLMCVNRDELADMLGLGVTTWKMFVHHTLGIPRWPARALKSQKVKENKLLQKRLEAEQRGELDVAQRLQKELDRLTQAHLRRRKLFRGDDKLRVSMAPFKKKSGGQGETGGMN